MFKIGNIFYLDIAYHDEPDESKRRPVIVIGEEEELLLLISTTSSNPKNPPTFYDLYKIPIPNWRKSGLTKATWCRAAKLIKLPKSELKKVVKSNDFIGKLEPRDLNYILDELEKLHSS